MTRIVIAFVLFEFSTIAAAAGWPPPLPFLDMVDFAFWWELAFVVAAIPVLLCIGVVALVISLFTN